MTLYDKPNPPINIFLSEVEIIQNHYKDQIKEAIIANDADFILYISSGHIKLSNCIDEIDFFCSVA